MRLDVPVNPDKKQQVGSFLFHTHSGSMIAYTRCAPCWGGLEGC